MHHKENRPKLIETQLDAELGGVEQRTELYMQYSEGAAQTTTTLSANSDSGASGSARRQSVTLCYLSTNSSRIILIGHGSDASQGKNEQRSEAYMKYAERVAEFLTP